MELGPGAGQFRIHHYSHVLTAPGSFFQFDVNLVPKNPSRALSWNASIGLRNIDDIYYNDVDDLSAFLESGPQRRKNAGRGGVPLDLDGLLFLDQCMYSREPESFICRTIFGVAHYRKSVKDRTPVPVKLVGAM